jgi:hypothetical protein
MRSPTGAAGMPCLGPCHVQLLVRLCSLELLLVPQLQGIFLTLSTNIQVCVKHKAAIASSVW